MSDEGARPEGLRRRMRGGAIAGAAAIATAGEVRVAVDVISGIDTTSTDLTAAILNIAADIRAALPYLGQLVEALSKLGNNSTGGLTVRLGTPDIQIAELLSSNKRRVQSNRRATLKSCACGYAG